GIDPGAEEYLHNVVKMQERFLNRVSNLEGSRANCAVQAQQLRAMIENMQNQREKNMDILRNTAHEWNAMLAAAGFAASSLKAAKNAQAADKCGDEIFDMQQKTIESAHALTLNSRSRGAVDPAKLIEATERMRNMLDKEAEAAVERVKMLDETAKAL